MQTNLRIKNIVFVGGFNASIFDKYFFIKNKIITEEEILPQSVFDGFVIQLITQKIEILINPNQIIISSKFIKGENDEIQNITSRIIHLGNVTNITAFGINFHWYIEQIEKSVQQFSKENFYSNSIEIFSKFFNTDDSIFGIYASKIVKNARLKLDIKPAHNAQGNELIAFIFNFHFDIANTENKQQQILEHLQDYNYYEKESLNIISIYR